MCVSGILLHRNIDIVSNDNEILFRLREEHTCPNHQDLVYDLEGENSWRVKLKNPPKPPSQRSLLHKHPNLIVYKSYLKGDKYPYNPHCYPSSFKHGKNLFLHPWMLGNK